MRITAMLVTLLVAMSPWCCGDEQHENQIKGPNRPWTLAEALRRADLHEHDTYTRYVAVRLAALRGEAEKNRVLRSLVSRERDSLAFSRARDVNLFSFTSGAIAVHESLQRDLMFGEGRRRSDLAQFWRYGWNLDEIDLRSELNVGDEGLAEKATLLHPRDVTIDANGHLLVADFGNNRIRRIDQQGRITTIRQGSLGVQWNQGGLTVNDAGEIYYADELNNRILRIDRKGRIHVVLESPPVWLLMLDDEETVELDLSC